MIMRKKTLLALALLLPAALCARADGVAKLVKLKAGPLKGYPLSQSPVLTYPESGSEVQFSLAYTKDNDSKNAAWKLSEVDHYRFASTYFTLEDTAFSASLPSPGQYGAAILGRQLKKGEWNTFCVPFAMTATQVEETFGKGTQLRQYDKNEGTTIYFKAATSIEAGVAYLVKPTLENNDYNTTVADISVTSTAEPAKVSDAYGFQGIFKPVQGLATDGTNLMIVDGGHAAAFGTEEGHNRLRGMRAYIVCPKGSAVSQARQARLVLDGDDDGATTGISSVGGASDESPVKVYTLGGQYVADTTAGLPKGIYIVGGRKVVVK